MEFEKSLYELESSRIQESIAHNAFISDLKAKASQTANQLDAKCKELKIENDRITFKLKDTESTLRQLNEDKYNSINTITQLKSKLVKCQEDLIDAHNQLADANIQFAHQIDANTNIFNKKIDINNMEESFNYDEY